MPLRVRLQGRIPASLSPDQLALFRVPGEVAPNLPFSLSLSLWVRFHYCCHFAMFGLYSPPYILLLPGLQSPPNFLPHPPPHGALKHLSLFLPWGLFASCSQCLGRCHPKSLCGRLLLIITTSKRPLRTPSSANSHGHLNLPCLFGHVSFSPSL